MKVVVLDHPRLVNLARAEDVVNAPLSSCMFTGYVAAMLYPEGFDVHLVEANLMGWDCDGTASHLTEVAPDLLAVNLVYMWNETAPVLEMLQHIKEQLRPCHVTLFGYFPTFAYDFLLRGHVAVDSVIVGEPEMTALHLACALRDKKEWQTTPGLAVRSGNDVARNDPRPLTENLDLLPFPLRPDHSLRAKRGISPYILGSRGCYNQCSFCYLNAFYGFGPRWRGRSPENILRELLLVHAQEDMPYFYFADANFFGPGRSAQERALVLASMLKAALPSVAFGLECRANDVHKDTMAALRAAGLRDVFLGVESGCDKTLERLQKHLRPKANVRAIKILRDLDVHVSYGFIMFDPDSTLQEVRESFNFLKENRLLGIPSVTGHLLHHRTRVLKGTPLFKDVRSRPLSHLGSFAEYECAYRIADERVDLLARCAEPALRRILSVVADAHLGSCAESTLNKLAVEFFESSLSLLEKEKGSLPMTELERLVSRTIDELEKVRGAYSRRKFATGVIKETMA